MGLADAMICGVDIRRQSDKHHHAIGVLVRQRLHAIACGYPNDNAAGRLGADPIQNLLCARNRAAERTPNRRSEEERTPTCCAANPRLFLEVTEVGSDRCNLRRR